MKTAIIYILIGISVVLSAAFWWTKSHEAKPQNAAETIVKYVIDKHSIDSLTRERDDWKIQFNVAQGRINSISKDRLVLQNTQGELILYADSLEREIALRNDTACIKAITAKNRVIQRKDSIINWLDAETREYSRTIFIAQTTIQKDSLIISKQAQTIDNLSCAYGWKVKHKFWAWLFGWKCNQPHNQK